MKKYYLILLLFFTTISLIAQTDAINYQAVILNPQTQELPGVNAEGNILPNATINMRFTITNNDGSEAYQETQTVVTDTYGMVNLFIGKGNTTSTQSFNEINWDGTSKKLKVEIDFKGGNNFVFLSNQDLTFTPYAYHRNIIATGDINVDGKANFKGDFNIDGETNLNNNLNVAGTTNLNSTLNVKNGSESNLSGNLNVEGDATLNKTLNVTGVTNLNADLNVNGNFKLNNDLHIDGNATIKDSLQVKGNTVLANLVVKGSNDIGGGAGANHIALFENTSTSNKSDGIAIRIKGNASGKLGYRNRFITFYGKGDYVAGRIESYDFFAGDFYESFPIPDFANLINIFDFSKVLEWTPPSLTFSAGSLPSAYLHKGSLPYIDSKLNFHSGSLPSLDWSPGSLPKSSLDIGTINLNFDGFYNPKVASSAAGDIGAMVGWGMRNGYPGFLPTGPRKIALAVLILAAKQKAMDQGVIYGSKGADYAEWLEKENVDEKFVFGEVVGVKGGKISKNTTNADQVMSISLAPIVLGNMPDEHKKQNYEKVGFMGQVPVLTLGDVEIGDYIVASGFNDGYAKAISPKDITLKDLKQVIGKAWSSSNRHKISLINVSVGLKTNEWVEIMKQQENRLDNLELKIQKLEKIVNKMSTL
jgi:cytoskeletal protein CcmA (bactofilin family)